MLRVLLFWRSGVSDSNESTYTGTSESGVSHIPAMPILLALLFAPAMRRVTTRKLAVGSTGSEWNDHMRVEGDSPTRQSDVCPTKCSYLPDLRVSLYTKLWCLRHWKTLTINDRAVYNISRSVPLRGGISILWLWHSAGWSANSSHVSNLKTVESYNLVPKYGVSKFPDVLRHRSLLLFVPY